jgi:2-polyprenyl-3-methyl-5-hydroxy-6-metoxy-1,4-benzoquinol methylase
MKEYHYPDENDGLTIKFLAEFEKSAQYWDQSENTIIELIKKHISTINFKGKSRFLDAGCGNGRLITRFESHFNEIVAIEPDIQRLSNAKELVKSTGIEHKTSLYQTLAEKYTSAIKFDFILNSHVIQHIHTHNVKPLLKNLYDHLKDEGILAITTCHSYQSHDYYTKNYVLKGKPVMEITDEAHYNDLVDGSGLLPVHFFESDGFIKMLQEIGLETIDFSVFHVDKKEREQMKVQDIDAYVNGSKQLQDTHGWDMCLIVKKCLK